MSSAVKKVNMISRIVRLRQVVKRWKTKSLKPHYSSSSEPDEPAGSPRRRHTPSGSVAVYVGPERRRFVIPARFLNLPVFVALLDKAEEEFGFQPAGGLALPCEPGFFTDVVRFLEDDEERFGGLGLDGFLKLVTNVESYDEQSCCKEESSSFVFTPLLHTNARV